MTPESPPPGGSGRPEHYFEAVPTVPSRRSSIELSLEEGTFTLSVDRGVFSAHRVDPGTRELLRATAVTTRGTVDLPPGDVVDLGAGYGPISVVLAHRYAGRRLWAVEPNERARDLCRANLAANCPGATASVVAPEEVPPDLQVAALVSNPPIRIGKPALHALLGEWLGRLTRGGVAWFVVGRNLGADSLARWLGSTGHEVARLASRKGYRVLEVRPDGISPEG